MKKKYEAPAAEKVTFQYNQQVVASIRCEKVWVNIGDNSCTDGNKHLESLQ